MKLHEITEIFPPMSDSQLQELADNIQTNGLKRPILTYQGKIIDGRNRFHACKRAGIEPTFEKWDEKGSLWEVVFSLNEHKLQGLNKGQRACAAVNLLPFIRDERKQESLVRQRQSRRLRALTPDSGPQKKCFVCGQFQPITQAHHVLPISDYRDHIKRPELQETIWLCPNHHVILHKLRGSNLSNHVLWNLLSEEEHDKMREIIIMESDLAEILGQVD